jgi:hypothetical protein
MITNVVVAKFSKNKQLSQLFGKEKRKKPHQVLRVLVLSKLKISIIQ